MCIRDRYDTDGQPGIFIPNSMEMNAVREVAANMGGSLGSSINISVSYTHLDVYKRQHVVLVDTGNSYQGLCEMIRRKTNGADGVYFTYTEEKPISFNPFYTCLLYTSRCV